MKAPSPPTETLLGLNATKVFTLAIRLLLGVNQLDEIIIFQQHLCTLVLLMAMLLFQLPGGLRKLPVRTGFGRVSAQSMLKLQQKGADRARYPVVDVHTILGIDPQIQTTT